MFGGNQEFGYRSGTIPLPLVMGFTKAIELALKNEQKNSIQLSSQRDYLLNGLLANVPNIYLNGSKKNRLPHNLNITFFDVSGSLLQKKLKSKIVCSSGSACSNGKPSHVLLALGRSFQETEASVRFSIGLPTTRNEIDQSINIISELILSLRK